MSKKIASLFFSLTVVILGTRIFIDNLSIDFYTAIKFLQFVLPASIIMGIFGYFIGKILEKSKRIGQPSNLGSSKAQFDIDDLINMSVDPEIKDSESTELK